jgi:hypothetical protein
VSAAVLAWHRLRWPREMDLARLQAISRLLAAAAGAPVVLETVGREGAVEHRLALPLSRSDAVIEQLRAAAPGLGMVALERRRPIEPTRALELRLTTSQRALRIEQAEIVSRAVLTALALARRGEQLVLQWQLLTAVPPARVASGSGSGEPLPMSVADVLVGRRGRLDGEGRQALRAKRALPVWRLAGRLAVSAATPAREQMLLRELVAALRLADSPGVRLLAKTCSPMRIDRFGRSWFAPLRLNSAELITVSGWPVGLTAGAPIERNGGRALPPSKAVPTGRRVVGVSTFPGRERPLALSAHDGLRHLHLLGPTGTGKSTLLLNLIAQDIAAGRGVVVIEPKGDLIREVLERVPADRLDDVVLFDPADERQPVGLNPLARNGRPPELVADQLLALFRGMYESSWGPRTNDIMAASLLTLARTAGATLCALPALLGEPSFRHRVVSALDDPIGLEPFWQAYENWSAAERQAAIAPTLNRIRPFLVRPQLRAVLGQARPRFDFSQVFSRRKVVLVSLAKGALGSEAAALLGSLILTQLWAAALRRATVSPARRQPVFVYVDEVQDYLRLPTDLGEALVQARGLGVGFVLAHQHLSQLDPSTRAAVLTNARSRVCFQLATDDARVLASGALSSDDLRELPVFEVYAQLVAEGAVQPWCSARTLPPSSSLSDPDDLCKRSRARYGIDRRIIDAELEQMIGGRRFGADDLSPRRRNDRGGR